MTPIQKFVSELLLDFVVYGAHDLVEGGVFTGIPYSPTSFSSYLDWVYDTLDCDLRLRRQDHPDLTPETVLDLCQEEQVVFDVYEFLEKVFPVMAALDHDTMDYHERYLSLLVDETQATRYFEPVKVEEEYFPTVPPLVRQNGVCVSTTPPPLELNLPTLSEMASVKVKLDAIDSKYNDEEKSYEAGSDTPPSSEGDEIIDGGLYPSLEPVSQAYRAAKYALRPFPDHDWPKKAILEHAEKEYGMVGIKSLSKEKLLEVLMCEETRLQYYTPERLRELLQARGVQLKAKMSKKQLLACFK
jgi:hypothetical protein